MFRNTDLKSFYMAADPALLSCNVKFRNNNLKGYCALGYNLSNKR